jgi:hypothetical protein
MNRSINKLMVLALAALLLAAAIPAAAFAEDGTALLLDAANRYAGMAKSYGQGYIPTVAGGFATVVLPLVPDPQSSVRSIKNNEITVVPDFGSTTGSPFVISNMEAKVKQAKNKVNGGKKTVKCWLVSLKLPLRPTRANGVYPLVLNIKYTTRDGMAQTQAFTVYVTIADAAGPAPKPRVIVSRYSSAPETVMAGQEFDLSLDIKNTSETSAVRSIKVAVKGEGEDLIPVSEDSTQYF